VRPVRRFRLTHSVTWGLDALVSGRSLADTRERAKVRKGAAAGCGTAWERGNPSRGVASRETRRWSDGRESSGCRKRETRRTSWPEAGCNKPASDRAEQAIEAVRDREGGTRLGCSRSTRAEQGLALGSGRTDEIRRRSTSVNLERGEQQPRERCGVVRSRVERAESTAKCMRAARTHLGVDCGGRRLPEGPVR